MLFGKRIKELRESQKLPQRVVADALEITIPLYSRVERGERTLSKSHLPKLAQVLNVEENELLKLYLADQVALVLDGQTEIINDVLNIAKSGIDNMASQKKTHTLIDMFAGCGGLSLGMEQAGFHSIFFNEIMPVFASTYLFNRNIPEGHYYIGDINKLNEEIESYEYIWKDIEGGVDLVCGGPPCQGFSMANRQRIIDDPRNNLYKAYLQFLHPFCHKNT